METPKTLTELGIEWLAVKHDENKARDARIAIEEQIIAITGKRDEGSKTHDAGGCKITVTGKIARKMDWEAWESIKAKIPVNMHPVRYKPEVDEKGVKYLQANEPELYKLLPLEVKPAKPAIDVKVVEA